MRAARIHTLAHLPMMIKDWPRDKMHASFYIAMGASIPPVGQYAGTPTCPVEAVQGLQAADMVCIHRLLPVPVTRSGHFVL